MLDTGHGHFETAAFAGAAHPLAAGEARQAPLVEPVVSLARRFYSGMVDHFRLRAASWIMSVNMLGFGVSITLHPEVLAPPGNATIYDSLLRVAPASAWGLICLCLGGFRLASLIVNGTFPAFPWSPYIRALGSFLSALFWLQILLGAILTEHLTLAVSVFATFLAMDAFGLYVAALEIDPHEGGKA